MKKKINVLNTNQYPEEDNENFILDLYEKRELQFNKIPDRDEMKTYPEIKKYRNTKCNTVMKPMEQQAILSNIINPNTPYNGILIMHGTGTGKTCSSILIAEQFKDQIKKYNTKIYVLVPGPNTKENFKKELLFCTGDTYLKNKDILSQMSKQDRIREEKIASHTAQQSYKIISYKTFYKKVLGEKIVEKKLTNDNKIKTTYKKNKDGDIERESVIDKISNMDNSVLIVDEAHNLTNNEYGESLKKIIKASENLRVILLSATPMKNLADDIIDLLNFIRPIDKPIRRDKVFTSTEKNYLMKFKEGGEKYLKKHAKGYISFYRGNLPFLMAKRIDKGVIPEGLLFTYVIKCNMKQFQLESYNIAIKNIDDSLSKISSAASNFVFPGLDKEEKKIIGYSSLDGMNKVLNQLNVNKEVLIKNINKQLFNGKLSKDEMNNFLYENEDKNINGLILNKKFLKYFSIKFYKAFKRIGKLVEGRKGPGTSFVYSNLVKAGGMEIFAEVLKENGYLEYQENYKDYDIKENTLDYRTGKTYKEFKKKGLVNFRPATFILITGAADDSGDDIPEIKQKIIQEVFNSRNNIYGKNLKLVLGTKVMQEGVTLANIREIHILDVHYNLGKVDQVIGRGIRLCKHLDVTNDENKFPKVNVYKYVAAIKGTISTDETLYQKAELKYLLVKKVERILKEVAVDCPLLLNNNKFPEEIRKYKDCVYPTLENVKNKKKKICPALCDFMPCDFKCDEEKLNSKYYINNTYRPLNNDEVDYSTYNKNLAKNEIQNIKEDIKDLFRFKHIYTYNEILDNIKKSLNKHQKELFDEKLLHQSLMQLMPNINDENDFNNVYDIVYDKFNRSGYIIKRENFFIFQPYDQTELAPLYYRSKMDIEYKNNIPIENYIKEKYGKIKDEKIIQDDKDKEIKQPKGYNFDDIMDYYDSRDEFIIVGIIDKNLNKLASDKDDLFKIRPPRPKILDKKRGTDIPTIKGAVCSTSKTKNELINLLKKIPNVSDKEINNVIKTTRENICELIKIKLLYLEKYSTNKDKNKKTYIMIPNNHPRYRFPFNLEDCVQYKIKTMLKLINREIDYKVKKENNGKFNGKTNLPSYKIEFKENNYTKVFKKELEDIGFNLNKNVWTIEIL